MEYISSVSLDNVLQYRLIYLTSQHCREAEKIILLILGPIDHLLLSAISNAT